MKNSLILFLLGIFILACSLSKSDSVSKPINHDLWDDLLKKHVGVNGLVDYRGFISDSVLLNQYLDNLSKHHPNDQNWSKDEQLAYWINAYNAFTIKLVIDHYPTESIKKIKPGIPFINSVFDIKFIEIEDKLYDLNNIEHGIIRTQFEEPRIHFAINCASISCPALRNEAYIADNLDQQLQSAAINFINDVSKNKISADRLVLSRIFSWFRGDFGDNLISFLRPFTTIDIQEGANINFKAYNWQLNEASLEI